MEYSKSDLRKFHNYELEKDKLEKFEQEIKNGSMSDSIENFKMSEQLSSELFVPGYIGIVNDRKNEFLKQLPEIRDYKSGRPVYKLYIGIAASICLLVASMLIFQTSSLPTISDTARQASIAALNLDHFVTIERGGKTEMNKIVLLYEEGKYEELISEFKRDRKPDMLKLLEARSFMHLGDHEEAARLMHLLNNESFSQRDALLWSLVENSIYQSNGNSAKVFLNEIIEKDYPNKEKAENILSELNIN